MKVSTVTTPSSSDGTPPPANDPSSSPPSLAPGSSKGSDQEHEGKEENKEEDVPVEETMQELESQVNRMEEELDGVLVESVVSKDHDLIDLDLGDDEVKTPTSRRMSTQLNTRKIWITTPARTEGGLFRQGMRQSLSKYRAFSEHSSEYEYLNEADPEDTATNDPVIDGRTVTIAAVGKDTRKFTPVRVWDKEARPSLTPDVFQTFVRSATGFVLSKGNKLTTPTFNSTNNKFLVQVLNLQSQLNQLRNHMTQYDIIDVLTVVVPVDYQHTPTIETKTYDLLTDYSQLHVTNVAASCGWYNKWVTSPYIAQNMAFVLTLLQNNTDESLFALCRDQYDEFHPMEQGGPLMFYLILHRIQDSSEQALDQLKIQLEALDISTIPGEDVDQAVTLIKSTYRVLKCSSTPTRTYIPIDFVKTIFKIMQTPTVVEFTSLFERHLQDIRTKAFMTGTQPKWPKVSVVLNLATNSYRSMKATGVWDAAVGGKKSSYPAQNPPQALPAARTGPPPDDYSCWNCNVKGQHWLLRLS